MSATLPEMPDEAREIRTVLASAFARHGTTLEFVERGEYESGPCWQFRIEGTPFEAQVTILPEELDDGGEAWIVRSMTLLDEGPSAVLESLGTDLNRHTTLGAWEIDEHDATFNTAFRSDAETLELCATLTAFACLEGPMAMLRGQYALNSEPPAPPPATPSLWTAADFEACHADWSWCGEARLVERGWECQQENGLIVLTAVDDHPAWGGGLRVQVRTPVNSLGLDDLGSTEELDLHELHRLEWASPSAALFGGWYVVAEYDEAVFETFVPNALKDQRGLLEALFDWGTVRLAHVPDLLPLAAK